MFVGLIDAPQRSRDLGLLQGDLRPRFPQLQKKPQQHQLLISAVPTLEGFPTTETNDVAVDAEIFPEFSGKLVKFHPKWDSSLLWPLVQVLLKSSIHIKAQGHNPAGCSVLPGRKWLPLKQMGALWEPSVPPHSSTDNKNVQKSPFIT